MTDEKTKFKDKLEGCPETTRDMLNSALIEEQELSEENIQAIIYAHNEREHLFHRLRKIDPWSREGNAELRRGVDRLEELEFAMQAAWKFPQRREYHRWWHRIPHCQCRGMSIYEKFDLNQRAIHANCPAHGRPLTETNDVKLYRKEK